MKLLGRMEIVQRPVGVGTESMVIVRRSRFDLELDSRGTKASGSKLLGRGKMVGQKQESW